MTACVCGYPMADKTLLALLHDLAVLLVRSALTRLAKIAAQGFVSGNTAQPGLFLPCLIRYFYLILAQVHLRHHLPKRQTMQIDLLV